MLKIMVTTCNGRPPGSPIVAEFTEQGGSIGRASGNTLVLPDAQRYISRTHAVVFFRAGLYLIKDVGTSSPVFVNDWQLGTGQEAPIGNGDEIRIAEYSMRVIVDQAQVPADPPTSRPMTSVAQSNSAPTSAIDDPLAAFGGAPANNDPFADLILPPQGTPDKQPIAPSPPVASVVRSPPVVRPSLPAAPPPTNSAPSPIPDDFDPFADSTPKARPQPMPLPDDLGLGLGPAGGNQRIDDLYGLAPGEHHDPLRADAPLVGPFDAGANAASLDPLVAMGLVTPSTPTSLPPQRDNAPELSGSLRFPSPVFEEAPEEPKIEAPPDAPGVDRAVQARTEDASDEEPSKATLARPIPAAAQAPESQTIRKQPPAVEPISPPVQAVPPVTSVRKVDASAAGGGTAGPAARAQAIAAGSASPASHDELLRAYMRGAGVPEVEVPGGLTPELMYVLGELLRESTQGTIDLLHARAMAKRQLRAEMTMIVARENNPLKFSPTVEGAMAHLLAPQGRGFMTPLRSIKDAYNDLRSHEVGFVAGMRAALSGVLARFDPATLEKRLTRTSVLDTLVPMSRQAKLWALFEELYVEISAEAEDNFQSLFGREFMRAYEEQIAKLEQEERASRQ